MCEWLIFPRISFSRAVLFPNFFHLTKNLSRFFLSYLFAKFIITIFFFLDVLYAFLTKISKFDWKQGIKKNNYSNINTTKNCTFVHFKNYATLKTSKRIGLKLVLIISRSKEQVFNSFKDLVWFFDHLWYPADSKPFKTNSLRPRKYSYIS